MSNTKKDKQTTRKLSELLVEGEHIIIEDEIALNKQIRAGQEPELPTNLETYVDLAQELAGARAQIKLLRDVLEYVSGAAQGTLIREMCSAALAQTTTEAK